ncbi:hypothetical protein RN001_005823 [Aquatica leii]|uniref:Uncharacterized protein n=1 Tax=Aquatica leii TaxID=1421715 RepID=A0AAN7PCV0_9COLE|nr:hypothetical protein RN001_005823 [Aquatica leii]
MDSMDRKELDDGNDSQIEDVREYEVHDDGSLQLTSSSQTSARSQTSSCVSNSVSVDTAPKKRKRGQSQPELEKLAGAMTQLTKSWSHQKTIKMPRSSKYATFAHYVESKMLQMQEDVADEVEEKITNLLHEGLRKSKAATSI